MFILRLFHRDNPFEQIEARVLADGQLRIGRDPDADWSLADPERTLSRFHCRLEVLDGRLWLCDESTNGTFLATTGARAPTGAPVEIALGDTVRLGDLRILVESPHADFVGDATLTQPPPASATSPNEPMDGRSQVVARPGSLLEAFCKGAGIDLSALSSEDPEELMRRAGAIYQQTVVGLSALMIQRARSKSDHQLERTTISAAANNPFKWASTRKLTQELLCGAEPEFLSDAEAVRASFLDLQAHISAVSEGADAAAKAVLAALDPEEIAAQARSVAPSLLRSRSAACWDIYSRRHHELANGDDRPGPAVRGGFQAGYNHAEDAALR